MRKHKFGIIGAGNITSLRHIPTLLRSGRAELVGIVDRKLERAKQVAQRFGMPNWGDSLDVGWLDEVDAVTVGVPPMQHAEVSCNLLSRGKHVLQEKPMAMTMEEGERIAQTARDAGRVFAVVHNFQFARSAMRLRKLIERGELGEIRSLVAAQSSSPDRKLPVWAEDLPLGLFYDESPHLLYLLKSFGQGLELTGAGHLPSRTVPATPHMIHAYFDTPVAPGFLYANFESCVSEWHFAVVGSRKVGIMDVFRDILVTVPADGSHVAKDVMMTSLATSWTHWMGVMTAGWLHVRGRLLYGNEEVFRRFLDAIESGKPLVDIGVDDALSVMRTQHEILAHCQSGSSAPAAQPVG